MCFLRWQDMIDYKTSINWGDNTWIMPYTEQSFYDIVILSKIFAEKNAFIQVYWNGKCHFDEIFITGCTGSCQMTTSSAASDGNFIKMMTFSFQCIGIPTVEICQSYDPFISTMGFPTLVRWYLHTKTVGPLVTILPAPWYESMIVLPCISYCSSKAIQSTLKSC